MAITAISRDTLTQTVDIVRVISTDTLSVVGTSGYLTAQQANIEALNNGLFEYLTSDFFLVYASNGWGFFSITSDFTSLTAFSFTMSVVGTPVVVGDFAVFASTSGNIEDLGYLPSNAAKTSVVMATGAVTVGNIAVYEDTAGTIGQNAATAINAGNIQAGLSGTAGTVTSFPGTASKGSLKLVAVANTGNTATTISNAAMGQASVVTIPDPGTATADFVVAPAALVNGNLVKASGTAGLVADAAFSIHAGTTASYAGGGTTNTFTTTNMTSSSIVTAVILTSTNSVSITKAVPGTNTLAITFSSDPGSATTVSWISLSAAVA